MYQIIHWDRLGSMDMEIKPSYREASIYIGKVRKTNPTMIACLSLDIDKGSCVPIPCTSIE